MLDKSSLGPDAEITTNAQGGKQSATLGRFDLLPAHAVMRVAQVLQHGASRYSVNNWRKIPMESHINHALQHIFALMDGDLHDDHLGHAACRIMMALEQESAFDFRACPDDELLLAHMTDEQFKQACHVEDFDGEIDSHIAAATTFGTVENEALLNARLDHIDNALKYGESKPFPTLKSLFGRIGKATPKTPALTEQNQAAE